MPGRHDSTRNGSESPRDARVFVRDTTFFGFSGDYQSKSWCRSLDGLDVAIVQGSG